MTRGGTRPAQRAQAPSPKALARLGSRGGLSARPSATLVRSAGAAVEGPTATPFISRASGALGGTSAHRRPRNRPT